MELGEEIASQSWRNSSWSNVYEYNEKFYSLDEVDMVEFDSPQDAFKRAKSYDRRQVSQLQEWAKEHNKTVCK